QREGCHDDQGADETTHAFLSCPRRSRDAVRCSNTIQTRVKPPPQKLLPMVNSKRIPSSSGLRVSGILHSNRRGPRGENHRTPKPTECNIPSGRSFSLNSKKFSSTPKALPMS